MKFYKRCVQHNLLCGSCIILHQLKRTCNINIAYNQFCAEPSVIVMSTWQCVLLSYFNNRILIFFRQSNAFQFTKYMVESVSLKVLALKQFFEEQMKFPFNHQLSVLEFRDLNFATFEKIAFGCNGVVCKIQVNVEEFKERTHTHCPIDELAIKMIFTIIEDPYAEVLKERRFDKEYIFPIANPHWSHVQIFNYFRGRRVDSLLVGKEDFLEFLEDKATYFIMELCKSNLRSYIKENKDNISVSSALLMIYQILDGIKHLYDHEVVHLDLKDDNIFIVDRKKLKGTQVVVGDFGTIHPFIYKDHEGSTLIYRSPELLQFKGNIPVDIRKNDVWAAGCILFQLLEDGRHPFDYSQGDIKFNICTASLPLLDFDRHGEGTKQFLKLLWNRDPDKRLDPTTALWICGLLLWGAPTDKYPINFTQFSPAELQTKFKTFCTTTCKQYSEQDCGQWIRHKINEIYASYYQNQNTDELSFILQVHFLTSISSSELLGAMKILSTIYD